MATAQGPVIRTKEMDLGEVWYARIVVDNMVVVWNRTIPNYQALRQLITDLFYKHELSQENLN